MYEKDKQEFRVKMSLGKHPGQSHVHERMFWNRLSNICFHNGFKSVSQKTFKPTFLVNADNSRSFAETRLSKRSTLASNRAISEWNLPYNHSSEEWKILTNIIKEEKKHKQAVTSQHTLQC